jgi:hypothetical protein
MIRLTVAYEITEEQLPLFEKTVSPYSKNITKKQDQTRSAELKNEIRKQNIMNKINTVGPIPIGKLHRSIARSTQKMSYPLFIKLIAELSTEGQIKINFSKNKDGMPTKIIGLKK